MFNPLSPHSVFFWSNPVGPRVSPSWLSPLVHCWSPSVGLISLEDGPCIPLEWCIHPQRTSMEPPTKHISKNPYLQTKENTKSMKSLKPPFQRMGDSKCFMQQPIRNSFCGMFHIPAHGLFPHISLPVISTRCGKEVCVEL